MVVGQPKFLTGIPVVAGNGHERAVHLLGGKVATLFLQLMQTLRERVQVRIPDFCFDLGCAVLRKLHELGHVVRATGLDAWAECGFPHASERLA